MVYIVNACGSLDPQFEYVKAELKQNIGKMTRSQSFSVIMLHDVGIDELGIGDEFGLFPATADNRKASQEWVQGRGAFSLGAYGDFARSLSRSLQRAFLRLHAFARVAGSNEKRQQAARTPKRLTPQLMRRVRSDAVRRSSEPREE